MLICNIKCLNMNYKIMIINHNKKNLILILTLRLSNKIHKFYPNKL